MVKHTQNCLSVFDHFVGLALKGFTVVKINDYDCYLFDKYILKMTDLQRII